MCQGAFLYNDKNIAAQLYWLLKVYAFLKALNFHLESVVGKFLIHRPSILDLRHFGAIVACFSSSSSPDP